MMYEKIYAIPSFSFIILIGVPFAWKPFLGSNFPSYLNVWSRDVLISSSFDIYL